MASDEELKKIKKKYGEKFMHMCRDLFPTILEHEGALFAILENTFANNSRTLYEDIHENDLEKSFKDFIYSKLETEDEADETIEERTPYELLDEAGYTLYECTTEEEIQSFAKYYASGEKLCTFSGGRLGHCVVFFAVKKDVNQIKREDFTEPKREDKYGTSVMSIQFYKSPTCCTVSIKNRYNHTVNNPDATYGNDLDRIIPGLSQSFENLLIERGLQFSRSNIERFSIPRYTVAADGRYYKYNVEIMGVYYCPGNIVMNGGEVIKVGEPERKILVDNFIVDIEKKRISDYLARTRLLDITAEDSFPDTFKDSIEKIEIVRDKELKDGERIIRIKKKDTEAKIEIRIDRDNRMIEYINEDLEGVRENFLRYNTQLRRLILPKLKNAGDHFLSNNSDLEYLELPMLRVAHNAFLFCNRGLTGLELPELIRAGNSFLFENTLIKKVSFPKLEIVGYGFLSSNSRLRVLELPCLRTTGNNFMDSNQYLEHFFAPNLSMVGNYFLYYNIALEELELPSLVHAGSGFLRFNNKIKHLKVKNHKILENAVNKRLMVAERGVITPRLLAKLDKKGNISEFEIKLAESFIKAKNFINRHRRNGESKEK